MNSQKTKDRRALVQEAMKQKPFRIADLSLMTDDELDNLEELMKDDQVLVLVSISEAIEHGFTIPDDPEQTETELLKFLKNKLWKK